MHRISLVVGTAALIGAQTPLHAQADSSPAPARADTNPYAKLPHLEFTAQMLPGNPPPTVPRPLLDSLALPAQVLVMMIVDTTGNVDQRSVRFRQLPDPRLEPYIRETLSHWRFKPATYLGQPVRSVVEIPFVFRR